MALNRPRWALLNVSVPAHASLARALFPASSSFSASPPGAISARPRVLGSRDAAANRLRAASLMISSPRVGMSSAKTG